MASHAMYEYLIGKLSPNRAMSLLCRVEADVCMARTGNAWGDR